MNNAIHCASNPYQGNNKTVLCCCSAGLLRSPTAANVIHREFGHNTRAVGLEESYALIPINPQLLYWADEIVVMTASHADVVERLCKEHLGDVDWPRLIVLNIPDNYGYMDPSLKLMIKQGYQEASGDE